MFNGQAKPEEADKPAANHGGILSPPAISLPKGGGAIRGIGEKFAANPVNGTGSQTVPIALSPGQSGFGPQLSLSYDSRNGKGVFGMGCVVAVMAAGGGVVMHTLEPHQTRRGDLSPDGIVETLCDAVQRERKRSRKAKRSSWTSNKAE